MAKRRRPPRRSRLRSVEDPFQEESGGASSAEGGQAGPEEGRTVQKVEVADEPRFERPDIHRPRNAKLDGVDPGPIGRPLAKPLLDSDSEEESGVEAGDSKACKACPEGLGEEKSGPASTVSSVSPGVSDTAADPLGDEYFGWLLRSR